METTELHVDDIVIVPRAKLTGCDAGGFAAHLIGRVKDVHADDTVSVTVHDTMYGSNQNARRIRVAAGYCEPATPERIRELAAA